MNTQFNMPVSRAWNLLVFCSFSDFNVSTSFLNSSKTSSTSATGFSSCDSEFVSSFWELGTCETKYNRLRWLHSFRVNGKLCYLLLAVHFVSILVEKVVRFTDTLFFISVACANETFETGFQKQVLLLFRH